MQHGFLATFEKYELIAFFSGYAIVYLMVMGLWRKQGIFGIAKDRLIAYSYSITATLFLGYVLQKLFLGYSNGNGQLIIYRPYFVLFGILAVLFWIPSLSRLKALMLVHSLVFFALIPLDLAAYLIGSADREQVRNDMNMLTVSVVLNFSTFILAFAALLISRAIRR